MASSQDPYRLRSPLAEGTGRPATPSTPLSISPSSPTGSGLVMRTTPRARNANLPPIHVSPLSTSPPTVLSPTRAQTHRSLAIPPLSSPSSTITPTASDHTVPHRPTPSSYPSQIPSRTNTSTPPPRVHGSTSEHRASATTSYSQSLSSPCFIHSHLDHSLADHKAGGSSSSTGKKPRTKSSETAKETGLRKGSGGSKVLPPTGEGLRSEGTESRTAGSSTTGESVLDSNDEAIYSDADYNEEEDEERGNLTRQLAETAVSVREMSKQLGKLSLWFPRCDSAHLTFYVRRSRKGHYADSVGHDRHESSR